MGMAKTETVHTRVTHEIKKQADEIFSRLGLTTSQAIMLFLTAVVNHNGMPFELTVPEEEDEDLKFAISVATVDGVPPDENTKKLFRMYKEGVIDLDTVKYAIRRKYQQ